VGIRTLLARGAQWIVVSLPEPWGAEAERDFKIAHMKLLPGHLLGSVPVLFSRELCADPNDARRTATAVLNGFLHREMARFLYHAEGWVRERHVAQPLRIMRNDGACGRVAKTTAVKTLDSGPMGGLAGVGALARAAGEPRLVTVDVGGTSADIGIVEDERPAMDLFGSVHGMPLSFSFPALRTAALGGGSIVRVESGKIRIGPDSAGALPGPACFGRGGGDPTLTDAALVAGLLDAERFADGAIRLRSDLAESALTERVAGPLGLGDAHAAAAAVIEAFARALAAEIGLSLTRQRWDPAGAALVAFGGSGPLLSCAVAERLGIRRVIIPPASSSFSALGVSFAELAHEYRALLSTPIAGEAWRSAVGGMRERAARDMFGEGVSGDDCRTTIRVREEKTGAVIEVSDDGVSPTNLGDGGGRVTLDYRSTLPGTGLVDFPRAESPAGKGSSRRERPVLLGREARSIQVIEASSFATGDRGDGPCVLETLYWSALVPPGWRYEQTGSGLRLEREGEAK
jgi:N-methylhydantoinase A